MHQTKHSQRSYRWRIKNPCFNGGEACINSNTKFMHQIVISILVDPHNLHYKRIIQSKTRCKKHLQLISTRTIFMIYWSDGYLHSECHLAFLLVSDRLPSASLWPACHLAFLCIFVQEQFCKSEIYQKRKLVHAER